jgi:NADPH-dependent 2,4-dienoyl-CoA reductase/sulfur reductase-like enzyme
MSTRVSRRRFNTGLRTLGLGALAAGAPGLDALAASALSAPALSAPAGAAALGSARIVVVGGGFGGATCARFLKRLLPRATVALVEPNATYVACPFSNLVVVGLRPLEAQLFEHGALAREGIVVLQDSATDVDTKARTVTLAQGGHVNYDRLVLAPGIDFRWDALAGYDEAAAARMPHAWKAGPQTLLLHDQLRAMPEGGVVAMSVTAAPFRCPPGPYERASLIAEFLQRHKPRAKLLVLDSNSQFSKQPLFLQAWHERYEGIVQWRSAADDGRVNRVDAAGMTLFTDFDEVRADVVNVVPPQQAGAIAARAGVVDATGWCPVDPVSFASRLQPDVHVIGDAIIGAPMPKSAFSANAQAKVCAIQVARQLAGLAVEPTTLANTCYSYVAEDAAISVSGMYHTAGGAFADVAGAGGTSPLQAPDGLRQREALQARDWFAAITHEAFL